MGLRGFGPQTLTGAAQPMFGTTLSADVRPTPDMFTGLLDPKSQRAQTVLPVAQATMFRRGDKIQIAPAADFVQGNTTPIDEGLVSAVNYGGGTITVMGLTKPHALGETVVLSIQVASIYVRANADELYIGEDETVGAASTTLALYLLPGEIYNLGPSSVGNVYGTAHLWVLGTAADTFLPNLIQV